MNPDSQNTVQKKLSNPMTGDLGRLLLVVVALIADQVSKYMARKNFGLPGGEPDYFHIKQVLGEWVQFRLVYNTGAAFGLRPQSVLPFLNPTVFYVLFSSVAIGVLVYYYAKLRPLEVLQKTGVALILSGALGNLVDRLKFHKVTDFIDVGIPSYPIRWPTFNVADSCVCVGVTLIMLAPFFMSKSQSASSLPSSGATATGDNGASSAGS